MAEENEVASNPDLDVTMPDDVTLELGGTTYHLLFTFAALSIAQRKLAAAGRRFNMLAARNLAYWDADNLPYILLGAVVDRQPETTLEQLEPLINFENCGLIGDKLVEAYLAAAPIKKEQPEDDPTPEPATVQ
jgi:hypothetical protein